jgi:uncharacterized phage protein gp47/JayE
MAETELRYPTEDELHAQVLNELRFQYSLLGITVNVQRNSELWIRAKVFCRRAALAIRNGQIGLRDVNPLTAQGQKLLDLAAVFGVFPRPASASLGFWICRVLAPATSVNIPAAYKGEGPNGVRYEAVANTTVSDLGLIEMVATATGVRGDLKAGTVVRWESAAIGFLDQKATVAPGDMDGGTDTDSVEVVRQRLLRRLGFPAVGGNWAHVVQWAEEASAAVKFVAVHPNMRGPGSYDVAVLGAEPSPILNATVQNIVANKILKEHPGHVSINVTSAVLQQLDVVINLGAPLPKLAGGAGGGWIDSSPWPSTSESGVKAKITAVTPNQPLATITVDSTSADVPAVGKHIAIWDYAAVDANGNAAPKMREFSIVAVAGGSGAYVLTLDATASAAQFIEVGMYVSPAAERLQQYADAFVAAVGELGTGEKTADTDLLVYARRKPGPEVERPYNLTSRQLDVLTKGFDEVSDASFAARYETGTTNTRTSPSAPSVSSAAPRKLSIKYLAFRRTV